MHMHISCACTSTCACACACACACRQSVARVANTSRTARGLSRLRRGCSAGGSPPVADGSRSVAGVALCVAAVAAVAARRGSSRLSRRCRAAAAPLSPGVALWCRGVSRRVLGTSHKSRLHCVALLSRGVSQAVAGCCGCRVPHLFLSRLQHAHAHAHAHVTCTCTCTCTVLGHPLEGGVARGHPLLDNSLRPELVWLRSMVSDGRRPTPATQARNT